VSRESLDYDSSTLIDLSWKKVVEIYIVRTYALSVFQQYWEKVIQAALVIRGFFICKFDYSGSIKIHQTTGFVVFPSHICDFLMQTCIKLYLKWSFYAIQCYLVIRGFIIRGSLTERIYRELRWKPVLALRIGQSWPFKNNNFNNQYKALFKYLRYTIIQFS
jgi:hypothetical protein